MIRLLLVSESDHPVYSGAAIRFRRYLPGLRKRGVDVRVLTGTPKASKAGMSVVSPDWAAAADGARLPVQLVDGFEVHRIRLPDTGDRERATILARRTVEESQSRFQPHVVQTSALGPGWISALRDLRATGIRTVNVRTMVTPSPRNPLRRWRQRRRNIAFLREFDRVVVSSSLMRETMTGWGVHDSVVIPHGVDLSRFRPSGDAAERAETRRRWGVGEEDFVCLYAGPISPRKGVIKLLEAWEEVHSVFPQARLVLVGPRRDASDPSLSWFTSRVAALAQTAGGEDVVRFVGLVEDIERHLRSADLFAFTSTREGMPNVFAEAMATGLPIVTLPFAGLPAEFGRPGKEFRLIPDSASLSASIIDLVSDEGTRRQLATAARAWSVRALDVERSLDRYADLYASLAGGES